MTTARSIAISIASSIGQSLTGGGLSFSPLASFAAGEDGAFFAPWDISTLFQDSAGTTPVTAFGQPVGRILDMSGRGRHATQATAAARPTYQSVGGFPAIVFDGVDDFLSYTLGATPTSTTFIAAAVRTGGAGTGYLFNGSTLATNVGFALAAMVNGVQAISGNGTTTVTPQANGTTANNSIWFAQADGANASARYNNGTATSAASATNFNGTARRIGVNMAGGGFLGGAFFGGVDLSRIMTAQERLNWSRYLAARCGVTIP